MTVLTNGDMTEIGDNGVNLSGGQKQRVSLARAVYSDRDIYFLDDPLSAVDSKVAKSIFQECILGALKGKTVLFVTHGLQYLQQCDEVVVMEGGRIKDHCSFQELTKLNEGIIRQISFQQEDGSEESENHEKEEDGDDKENVKLVEDEKADSVITRFSAYKKYMYYCGGCCVTMLVFTIFVLFVLSILFPSIWLRIWLDSGDGRESERRRNATEFNLTLSGNELKGFVTDNPDMTFYQTVYGCSVFAMLVLGALKGYSFTRQTVRGSSAMHYRMFRRVLSTPLTFFDTTPKGRILNRFTSDMDELDVRMPHFLQGFLHLILFSVSQLVTVCVIFPAFLIAIGIIVGVFLFLDLLLNKGLRECKKWENVLRSHVTQAITSSAAGLSTIRTFQRERIYCEKFSKILDNHLATLIVYNMANRWFSFRMDAVGLVIVFATALISVLSKGTSSASDTGLALSLVFSVLNTMSLIMRMKADVNAKFTSVERRGVVLGGRSRAIALPRKLS